MHGWPHHTGVLYADGLQLVLDFAGLQSPTSLVALLKSLSVGFATAAEAMPWHFRGRRYAFAAFQMLLDRFQLSEATDVLLVGDSTGGAGMTQLTDDLHELVQSGLFMPHQSHLCPATNAVEATMLFIAAMAISSAHVQLLSMSDAMATRVFM